MDEFGATFGRVSKYLRGQRMNAAAATLSRFEDGHRLAGARKLSRSHQASSSCADDQDMGTIKTWVGHLAPILFT